MDFDYDNTLSTDERSRSRLQIAAAYANVAMRAGLTIEELRECTVGPINEARARAFAVMMNLAFALEVAFKGKITDEMLNTITRGRDKHDLKILYGKLPKIEQEQLKMEVKDILVIDDSAFNEYLELCRNGLIEWRYFFEPDKAGKEYNYLGITLFLYASVYYLIAGEQNDSLLEPCTFKKQCYVGQWGVLRTKYALSVEYRNAEKTALKDGNGIISEPDQKWLQSIKERQQINDKEIHRIEKNYDEKNTSATYPAGLSMLKSSN